MSATATDFFAVLPAPDGYRLIKIDDNVCEGDIDRWLSEPKIVLGFVIRKQQTFFSVLPVTAFDVHDDGGTGQHALIRPDGKVEFNDCGELIFASIEDLKQYLLRSNAEVFRDHAQDCLKAGDKKAAARFSKHAQKLEDEAEGRS